MLLTVLSSASDRTIFVNTSHQLRGVCQIARTAAHGNLLLEFSKNSAPRPPYLGPLWRLISFLHSAALSEQLTAALEVEEEVARAVDDDDLVSVAAGDAPAVRARRRRGRCPPARPRTSSPLDMAAEQLMKQPCGLQRTGLELYHTR